MKRLAIIGFLCLGSLGCRITPQHINALSKDGAILQLKINTVYGTSSVTRIGTTTNTVTVAPDGTVTVNK